MIFPPEIRGSVIKRNHSKGAIPKTEKRKLRRGVNWQGALKKRFKKQA